MKIMCLNGWAGKMHSALLPYIEQQQPDIRFEVVDDPEVSAH
ncbi:MAG: hypothetical protein ACJAVM_001897 [Sulfitobacter sp.]|jgi:hypothetical protein